MESSVKIFFEEIVNSPTFDGDYFKALCLAISLSRSFDFIKSILKGVNYER